jgi:hypothetical protein
MLAQSLATAIDVGTRGGGGGTAGALQWSPEAFGSGAAAPSG